MVLNDDLLRHHAELGIGQIAEEYLFLEFRFVGHCFLLVGKLFIFTAEFAEHAEIKS